MNPKRIVAVVLLAALALLPLHVSQAGGWASVEIVEGPEVLESGEPMTFQLAVKQHGITPVDSDPLVITAVNDETGESFTATAVKAPGEGNYTVELTFPSDGTWELEGAAGGLAAFDMGPMTIGQALNARSLTAPGGALVIDITGDMGGGIFEPGTSEIAAGTMVVWTNNSVEGHTIVINGMEERSGLIGPGADYAVIFDEPGTYRYDCGPHPNMKGEITVI
jgi:plastocyanin